MEGAVAGTAHDDEGRFVGFANDDLVIGTFPDRDPQYVDFSAADVATVHAVWRYTVTSPERVYALIRAVEYLVADELVGDIVECGVWRGGSMMAVARTVRAENPVHGSELSRQPSGVMIIGHVPLVHVPPDHAANGVAAARPA
jgi:Macrocin-O-methyltransferase (TylF)